MKTTMLTLVAVFFSSLLFAQKMTYDAGRTTFGVRAGVNFFNITGKDYNGDKFKNNVRTGFDVGVNAEIPVGTGSYLQPGVLFSEKGADLKNSGNLRLNYIEIPVNFVYKPVLGTGRLLLGVGPYLGYGIGGKLKGTNGTETNVVFTNTYNVNNLSQPQFKRVDYGGNLLAGYEFKNNFSFQLNAQLGLANIAPEQTSNSKAKENNTGFGVSVGYRF